MLERKFIAKRESHESSVSSQPKRAKEIRKSSHFIEFSKFHKNCYYHLVWRCSGFLRLRVTQKALQLPFFLFLFFSFLLFLLLLSVFGLTAESFLANVLRLVTKEACDQDLTHSLDTPIGISVKIFPRVVIRDACGTWHGLFTVAFAPSKKAQELISRNSETS